MILNEHQYKVTKGKIDDLQRLLDTLDAEQADVPPLMVEATRKGFAMKIAEMSQELAEYNELKAGRSEIIMGVVADLPIACIKKRIKLGMTQRELAEKLGMKEQMIQRYEASQYESAGFGRLVAVAEALEIAIPLTTVRGPKPPKPMVKELSLAIYNAPTFSGLAGEAKTQTKNELITCYAA
jgi:HTH-type transcriptional regulator / antitoxin HipB